MEKVQIGIIGGSGLYDMAGVTDREEVKLTTPFGEPSDPYLMGTLRGRRVAFLARHGAGHRILPSELNFRANIFGMKLLGVEYILSASAVGSLKEEYKPLDIVIPDQFFDRTKGRPSTFFGRGLAAHVGFAHPFCWILSGLAYESGRQARATVHKGGTYVCMEGPQFSTLAESKLYRAWGMDIIGMTNLQEAKLAREAEICYTTIALVTDYDCWHPDHDSVTVEMVLSHLTQNATKAQEIIAGAVARLPYERTCECASALQYALVTRPDAMSDQMKKELAPMIRQIPGGREVTAMKLVVTGSIAYDYLMSFPGKFTEHFLPEHMQRVSLSFLVDSMDKRRGGCAPNIAYTLALLGERPYLMGTAGQDFGEYRQWLNAVGVDTSLVQQVPNKFTASFFCSTDTENNQIASFYTGAMAHAVELSFRTVHGPGLVIVSPNDPAAMIQYAEECRTLRIPYIFDPGQQCARMSGPELQDGLVGARIVICNDYEFELIRQKTGMGESDVLEVTDAMTVTRGEEGCSIYQKGSRIDVKAVAPYRIVDPTGVGDAFRGGFMKGMAAGAPYKTCAQFGSVAASYALEHLGGQSHAYTLGEFKARYEEHFGPYPV